MMELHDATAETDDGQRASCSAAETTSDLRRSAIVEKGIDATDHSEIG